MHQNGAVDYRIVNSDIADQLGLRPIQRLSRDKFIVEVIGLDSMTSNFGRKLDNNWKLSPRTKVEKNLKKNLAILVQVRDIADAFSKFTDLGCKPKLENKPLKIISVTFPMPQLSLLLEDFNVTYIDVKTDVAYEEATIRSHDLFINGIELAQSRQPGLTGAGITVSVKERSIIESDIDLKERNFTTYQTDSITSLHATEVATLIGGAGNSNKSGYGVVPGAMITSSNFNSLFADAKSYFEDFEISVQNNSYGSGIDNFYSLEAQTYDNLIFDKPELAIVFSSGNAGEDASLNGPYQGLIGYSNLTGSYKQAKNIILVGATNDQAEVNTRSSKGPTYDGRLKPDLIAFGGEGTSDAAALVSGSVAFLQQYYKTQYGEFPSVALIKSLLFAGAESYGTSILSYNSGFGSLNLDNALEILMGNQFITGTIASGTSIAHGIKIPEDIVNLRIALSWTDPPANPGDYKALINNLDLKFRNKITNEIWSPWVLPTSAEQTALEQQPQRGLDSLNTAEFISLQNPIAGEYEILLESNTLLNEQQYAVSYYLDRADEFAWYNPVLNSKFESGEQVKLRWRNTNLIDVGSLFIAYGSESWQLVDANVNLSSPYFELQLKDTVSSARVMMKIGNREEISTNFTVSPKPVWNVAFDCDDEGLLTWEKLEGIQNYNIEVLSGETFQPLIETEDTSYLINKSVLSSNYFRVSTKLADQMSGISTDAIDITMQNAGCYIKQFSGLINEDNIGELQIALGTNYNVESVSLKNLSTNATLGVSLTDQLTYTGYDFEALDGFQAYQASVELFDGRNIKSDTLFLTYFKEDQAMVFPNPVLRSEGLLVITPTVDPSFELVDTSGRPVFQTVISGNAEYLFFENLRPGVYIYRIMDEERLLETARLILY